MTMTIFLSHSTQDKEVVAAIADAVQGQGLQAWMDVRQLTAGDELEPAIRTAIEQAAQFVVVLSPSALESDWVRKEIETARTVAASRKDGYKLIPVLIGGVQPESVQSLLGADVLAIEIDDRRGAVEAALPRLLAAIQSLPPGDVVAPSAVTAAPVADLVLRLDQPAIELSEGKRRATATARLEYQPADGPPLASEPFRFTAPLGPIEAGELTWYLERYWRWPGGVFAERAKLVEAQLPRWGQLLYRAIRQPSARTVIDAWRRSGHRTQPRFTVLIDRESLQGAVNDPTDRTDPSDPTDRSDDPATADEAATLLLSLPWELLHDGLGYLFQGARGVRVRRRLSGAEQAEPPPSPPPIRVLLVSPRPDDEQSGYIDHRISARPVVEALRPLGELAEWTILNPPTFQALEAELRRAYQAGQAYHVVHFDGHGVFDRRHGLGALCFEEPADVHKTHNRRTHIVRADQLAAALRDYETPLFFLEACQTAQAEDTPTASVAGRLLACGVGSVAAMSHSVLVETARRFVQVFYHRVMAGDRVGQAMLAAQLALHGDRVRGRLLAGELRLDDWFVPVLFQQQHDPQVITAVTDEQVRQVIARGEQLALGAVPDPPPHTFVGRSRLLLQAERILCSPWDRLPACQDFPVASADGPGRYVVFRGEGGEGKTALASELSRWLVQSRRFRRAAFVSLEHDGTARAVLWKLGEQLVPNFGGQAGGDDQRGLGLVRRALEQRATILVLDNMESVLPADDSVVVRGSPDGVVRGSPDGVVRGSPDGVVRGSPDPAPGATAGLPEPGELRSAVAAGAGDPRRTETFEPEILAAILKLAAELNAVGQTRVVFTSREPLPAPFENHHMTIGRLERGEAIALVARVLGRNDAPLDAGEIGQDEDQITALVEAVGCHARSLVLLAREVASSGVRLATERLHQLMEQLHEKYPDNRQRSLLASVELSLRRLPPQTQALLGPLGVFQGGGHTQIIGMVLGLDIQKDEELALAQQLVHVGLGEMLPYGYLRLDPALGAALLRKLDAGRRDASRAAWAQAMQAFTGYLSQQQFKVPQMAATLTLLDLPNLLAALEHLYAAAETGSGVAFGQESSGMEETLAENDSRPLPPPVNFDAVVGMATRLEGLLQNLGRPRALACVAKLRAQAAERLGQWSNARFIAEDAAVDRLLGAGRVGEAYEAAKAVLEHALAADEDAYDVAAYDIAVAHFRLGRVLKKGGAAEAALAPITEARRRFRRLPEASNQSAARMASVCLTESGDCLRNLGRLDEAAAAYEESIKLASSLGDDRQVATGKGQLGTVRMLQRRYAEALAAWSEFRQTFEQLGEPSSVAIAWHQIGMVYEEAEQYESAESAYQEALKIDVRLGDRAGEASTLDQLGILYAAMNRLEESVRFHKQAATIRAELGDLASEGRSRSNLGIRLIMLRRYDDARRELLRAIECKQPYGHAAQPWKTFAILYDLERAVGNPTAAATARQQARDAYLAYRRAGGESQMTGAAPQLVAMAYEAVQSGQIAVAAGQFDTLLKRRDLPGDLSSLLTSLRSILNGNRDPAIAADPNLYYRVAAELQLLLERFVASGPRGS